MLSYEKIKEVLGATEDPTKRKIRFLALLTASLPKNEPKPILVGGSAVEVYLDGVLRTGDMDIVYRIAELKKILKAWHFKTSSYLRNYVNEDLVLAVDLVGEKLDGSYDKLFTITTGYGIARIIGVEDLILKRLASAKFWNVSTDMEQSYLLAKSQENSIDWGYLETRAKEENVEDYLDQLRETLRSKTKKKRRN